MNVWHAVYRPESLTYTIAKALSYGGHDVVIWVADPEYGESAVEGIRRRIADTPRVRILPASALRLPSEIDRLIVQVYPRPVESMNSVGALVTRADKIALITSGDRSRSLRDAISLQWLEFRKLARCARRVDRVLYKDGYYPRDLYGPFKPRTITGFDAHSQFLHEERLFRAMHARDWRPESRRPILVNFLGSRDPAPRTQILDSVRSLFASGGEDHLCGNGGKTMHWHEYSDAAPVGIEPLEFVSVLSRSDFTLCPRGYSLVTHRPVEALLRGSVPVLAGDELDLYGMKLVHGENCIGVAEGRWAEAVQHLSSLDEPRIVAMRSAIHAMFGADLDYGSVSRKIRTRLGVAD